MGDRRKRGKRGKTEERGKTGKKEGRSWGERGKKEAGKREK